jgi:hypothetical protein
MSSKDDIGEEWVVQSNEITHFFDELKEGGFMWSFRTIAQDLNFSTTSGKVQPRTSTSVFIQ